MAKGKWFSFVFAWKRCGVKLLTVLAVFAIAFPFEYVSKHFRLPPVPSLFLDDLEDGHVQHDASWSHQGGGDAPNPLQSAAEVVGATRSAETQDVHLNTLREKGGIVWKVSKSESAFRDTGAVVRESEGEGVPKHATNPWGEEKRNAGAAGRVGNAGEAAVASSAVASSAVTRQGEDSERHSVLEEATRKAAGAMAAWRARHAEVEAREAKAKGRHAGCATCCNDGESWGVACLDVDACAAEAPSLGGRYAFVYAQVGRPGWPWLTFIDSMKVQALALAFETNSTVDIILLMPPKDIQQLGSRHWDLIRRYDVRLVEVPWTIPPTLTWWPKHWWPGKLDGWCGPQDLVRLHVLGLEGYDAVAFYDQDVEFQGDAGTILRCAATGRFLSTSGGVGEPLNVGFFAVRPDRRLLHAAEIFASNVTFSEKTGWANSGFKPSSGYFVGAECGQGYFHTLFYQKKSAKAQKALVAAGLAGPGATLTIRASQIDRCVWNYQTGHQCPANFNCERVRVHHKPTGKPVGADCTKLARRQSVPALLSLGELPSSLPGKWASLGCKAQFVSIGANCKCQGENYIKTISARGVVKACEVDISNPSGDTFRISFNGSTITATRTDARSCWCDDSIEAHCCIAESGKQDRGRVAAKPKAGSREAKADINMKSTDSARGWEKERPGLEFQTPAVQEIIKGWHRVPPPKKGCANCCHDGERWGVPCFDVEACASQALTGGKYAFVYAQVGPPRWPWLTFIDSMHRQAQLLASRSNGTAEIVVLIPPKDAQRFSSQHLKLIEKYSVRVIEVPWTLPPALRWWPKDWWPGKPDGWCGPQDLVRLHVLGLDDYDAVAFYDQDIEFQGDAAPVLLCASTGRFLSTSGGVGEPLNVGFFALRPDRRLLKAAELFAEGISFDRKTGWGSSGFKPADGYFIGAECGQGYVHSLIYQKHSIRARHALLAAGLSEVSAVQLDRCVWNYQTGSGCPARFDCNLVQVHHKPTGKPLGRDCAKLARQADRSTPSPPRKAELGIKLPLPCEVQTLNVGSNCKCAGENYIKSINIPGYIVDCQPLVQNPSGDSFSISFASSVNGSGSQLVATRDDSNSCWCDNILNVQCCVIAPLALATLGKST